ncbi:MAG TPA: hypothetical protein DER17_07950 [Oscillibacter sp.]|nr:hypothetical protein [Oscillibacter sp.]
MAGKRLAKPNKRRLPLRAWLLYLAVATFALTGVTFSRYVASAHSQDEGRVITFGDLTVTDSGSVQVQPGVPAQKDLTVHFDGSEAAVYVFAEVQDGWTRGADGIYHDAAGLMTWRVVDGWTHLQDNVYYRELAPNTVLDAGLIDGGAVNVSEDMTRTELEKLSKALSIRVRAAAVQREGGDTAETAWARVNG